MQRLTIQGQQRIEAIAQRYGLSTDAVSTLLEALVAGHGTMAQFNHPELGGSGQWMHDGMIMVGDMFNNALKAKVDSVCTELAQLLVQQPGVRQSVRSQSQSQSQGGQQPASSEVSLFLPTASGAPGPWWPVEFGRPSSSGVQNNIRYAYFPAARRLVLAINDRVTVYDTLDHQISGISQQQSAGASLAFTSQFGVVQLMSLPVVSVDGVPQGATRTAHQPEPGLSAPAAQSQEAIIAMIERLAALHTKGILSEEEFTAKKTELLKRL